VPHSRTSLLCHLFGTYEILAQWRCEQWVCDSGLFHAIYGTAAFPLVRSQPLGRQQLQAVIGARSEALVHLFARISSSSLCEALHGANGPYRLLDREDSSTIMVQLDQFQALCHLVAANWLEQSNRHPAGHAMYRPVLFRLTAFLNEHACRALAERAALPLHRNDPHL
jgi:hypothetical protein